MNIKFFNESVEIFLTNLEKGTIAKTLRILDLLETFGKHLGMPHSKKVDEYLFELRIRGKKEVRFIYCFKQKDIIILHGFIKKDQKILKKDLSLARNRFNTLD